VSTQIQIRRDTTASWSNVDPVLAQGEIGYDLTEEKFKVGDGATAWSGLGFSSSSSDVDLSDYYTKTEANAAFKPASYTAPVGSVNGETGEVVLTASDVGALPDSTVIPPPADLTGYATETWVNNQNFATQTWVNNKGYSTYTGSDAVKTTGAQTIAGVKTFSSNVKAPDFVASSDERLKDNITTAPVGLIDSLKGRDWDWSESGERGSGVVAQELEQVLPHLVHEDDDGMKSVSYNGLIAYLIEEIKDLKSQVEALKNG
jgi:hypothetical protein